MLSSRGGDPADRDSSGGRGGGSQSGPAARHRGQPPRQRGLLHRQGHQGQLWVVIKHLLLLTPELLQVTDPDPGCGLSDYERILGQYSGLFNLRQVYSGSSQSYNNGLVD